MQAVICLNNRTNNRTYFRAMPKVAIIKHILNKEVPVRNQAELRVKNKIPDKKKKKSCTKTYARWEKKLIENRYKPYLYFNFS